MGHHTLIEKSNRGYRIKIEQGDNGRLIFMLHDIQMDFELANAPYLYHLNRKLHVGESRLCEGLADVSVTGERDTIRITGTLGGLEVTHEIRLPASEALFEERISLHNPEAEAVELIDFACAWQHRITNDVGALLPGLMADRMVAIPFRHGPTDLLGTDFDFSFERLASGTGRELRINALAPLPWGHGYVRSSRYFSEGWAWTHGDHSLGIFKFNQDAMEFSVLDTRVDQGGTLLCFGGVGLRDGEPAVITKIQAGETVSLGVTHYETRPGDFTEAYYAFRQFLDRNGCHFPASFNPPVHWNELYDNAEYTLATAGRPPGKRKTRHITYTQDLMLQEAAKARDYSCEALYLDPGWDTEFGSFIWGKEWLGDRKQFIDTVRNQYGLQVSLHCPLATWMSFDQRGVSHWPESAQCTDEKGAGMRIHHWRVTSESAKTDPGAPMLCLGSKQYLDEAERRLLEHCADGVKFLMFDGNWYNTGCFNPEHGHPIPYTREDHVAANLELAQRIHAKYPDVLIEMHDMVVGGSVLRFTPVYYKYGLPGSYDVNWGFELMWRPMEDILSGRALALYYYNLGCNVPVYLHVDLRGDNEHALILWWYASTCRHLGIGGTHENPMIAETHRQAMKRYQKLARFFKEGEFYGANEEVHFHVLADESAFIAVVFNLSDQPRVVTGTIEFEKAGLDRDRWYDSPIVHESGGFNAELGTFTVARRLAPWSAQVVEVFPLNLE
jgi:hypothetical protein